MHGETLHWGICSAGRICNDFVNALSVLPKEDHQVKAVASSSLERAKKFAEDHSIPSAYGTYKELADDPIVDVVYVGSINSQHYGHVKMMLEAGKSVLCEKPFSLYTKHTKELFALAKQKGIFLMEGIWSRFFPVYKFVQKAIDDGEIGEVRSVQSSFGENLFTETNRLSSKELGGGAIFDIGIYQIQLSQFVHRDKPEAQVTKGFLSDGGVDIMSDTILQYPNQKLASMATSVVCHLNNEASICGRDGFIKIHAPFWCPTDVTIKGKTMNFPLPETNKKFNFKNSVGFSYEAQEVRRCLMEGIIESPTVSHAMSIEIAEIIENSRRQLGYILPED